jgi:hypothetical protein
LRFGSGGIVLEEFRPRAGVALHFQQCFIVQRIRVHNFITPSSFALRSWHKKNRPFGRAAFCSNWRMFRMIANTHAKQPNRFARHE